MVEYGIKQTALPSANAGQDSAIIKAVKHDVVRRVVSGVI